LRVHRQIKHILRGGTIDKSDEAKDDLKAAASESSKRERAAMDVEREVLNLYRAVYMKSHIGDELEGRMTGMSGAGIYITVEDPCVDVMVLFDDLGQDQFETDEQELGVIGVRSGERIMMGDLITVIITDAAIVRRTVYGRRLVGDEDGDYEAHPRPRSANKTFRDNTRNRGASSGPTPRRPGARSFKPDRQEEKNGSRRTESGADRKSGSDRKSSSRTKTASRTSSIIGGAGTTSARSTKGRSSSTKKAGAKTNQARTTRKTSGKKSTSRRR
jgi:ribonuclease R